MAKAIIDADSFLYRAAISCEELRQIDSNEYMVVYNVVNSEEYLKSFINKIKERLNVDDYIFVIGGGNNFRYKINPSYKSNRKSQKKPIMLNTVIDRCKVIFNMCWINGLEADDTCRVLYEQDRDNIIVSIDKDLRTFENKIYNPDTDTIKYTSKVQADNNLKRQLLMGDSCDGYHGLKGIGPKTADKKILEGITTEGILDLYLENGYSVEDFERMYNCAKIIGNDDYSNGVLTLYGGKQFEIGSN